METLNQLKKITTKSARRVGRGIGSKQGGHTTGKGAKGDKVRGKTKITFDGSKIKKGWIKRTPFLRGKHRTLKLATALEINLNQLEKWYQADDLVNQESLAKKMGLELAQIGSNIKILSTGKLTKILNFSGLRLSAAAAKKITALGGKIE